MGELTEAELPCLRWCNEVNTEGVGFLGPSVRRDGPVAGYAGLIERGLVRLVPQSAFSRVEDEGYWITPAGRAALHPTDEAPAMAAVHAQGVASQAASEGLQLHGAGGPTLEHPLHPWTYRLRWLNGDLGGTQAGFG